jgi:hypothetical protein
VAHKRGTRRPTADDDKQKRHARRLTLPHVLARQFTLLKPRRCRGRDAQEEPRSAHRREAPNEANDDGFRDRLSDRRTLSGRSHFSPPARETRTRVTCAARELCREVERDGSYREALQPKRARGGVGTPRARGRDEGAGKVRGGGGRVSIWELEDADSDARKFCDREERDRLRR